MRIDGPILVILEKLGQNSPAIVKILSGMEAANSRVQGVCVEARDWRDAIVSSARRAK